jgi:hypothetical protein
MKILNKTMDMSGASQSPRPLSKVKTASSDAALSDRDFDEIVTAKQAEAEALLKRLFAAHKNDSNAVFAALVAMDDSAKLPKS